MQPSVTVVEVTGDDDDEWGEEEEVVVWSNSTATNHASSLHQPHSTSGGRSGSVSVGNAARDGKGGQGGHPLLVASVANLAISYNVVRAWEPEESLAVVPYSSITHFLFTLGYAYYPTAGYRFLYLRGGSSWSCLAYWK